MDRMNGAVVKNESRLLAAVVGGIITTTVGSNMYHDDSHESMWFFIISATNPANFPIFLPSSSPENWGQGIPGI